MLTLGSSGPLRGEISLPGDKSISHRAVMFGALARGTTYIEGFSDGTDCLSTVDCFRRLGVDIILSEDRRCVRVKGQGMRGLSPKENEVRLYTGNSGTTTRIISGILSPQSFTSILSGDSSVNRRPMERIIKPLRAMGAHIVSLEGNSCAPLKITGSPLKGITWHSPVASAQVKSAILCAGLYAEGPTTVIEPALSRDHTERMLRSFGALVTSAPCSGGYAATVLPCEELLPSDLLIPGDISSAAYFIAAALLVPGSRILIRGVGINPSRAGILEAALAMGGRIEYLNRRSAAEPSADLLISSSSLHGCTIGGSMIPTLIDEIPVLAVMAACADGTTVIKDAAELRFKESDRIAAVTENLRAMGADIEDTPDGMIIRGGKPLHGASVRTFGDHRLAMSFAAAALAADGETTLDDETCAAVSYPGFFDALKSLSV